MNNNNILLDEEKVIFDLKIINTKKYKIRELKPSPMGNKVGLILLDKETETFFLNENGEIKNKEPWDNAWNLTYSSNEKVYAFLSKMGTWSLFCDGKEIGDYEYVWNLIFNDKDSYAVAIKKNGQYGMLVDGVEWKNLYPYAMDFSIAQTTADTVATAQTELIDEKDVLAFKKGIFSLVKNGKKINGPFALIRYPTIDSGGENLAAISRNEYGKYKVLINDIVWDDEFDLAWEPVFHPIKHSLFVPVKKGKCWYLYKDGQKLWDSPFNQLWHLKFSKNGKTLIGICSKKYGKFTICVNGETWSKSFPVVEETIINNQGNKVIAVVNKKYPGLKVEKVIPILKKQLFLNNKEASDIYARLMFPKFSPDGSNYIAIGEKNGYFYLVVNGDTQDIKFSKIWEPHFIDNNKILLIGIIDQRVVKIIKKIN